MVELIIAPSAEADLNGIVDYISFELANPIAANAFLDDVEDAYDVLETNPLSFPFCDVPALRMRGYHQISIKSYLMVYRVEEDGTVVRILHVYHSSQDYLTRMIGEVV